MLYGVVINKEVQISRFKHILGTYSPRGLTVSNPSRGLYLLVASRLKGTFKQACITKLLLGLQQIEWSSTLCFRYCDQVYACFGSMDSSLLTCTASMETTFLLVVVNESFERL